MAEGQDIKKLIGKMLLGKGIKVAALTEGEKEELKRRIILSIGRLSESKA